MSDEDPQGFEKLDVYRRAESLVKPMYDLVLRFPDFEQYGLRSQIRKACRGIPAVIAEGYGRRSTPREFCRFLSYGVGSANEMEAHLRAATLLDYIPEEEKLQYVGEYRIVGKQLSSLIRYWERKAGYDARPTTFHIPHSNALEAR